MKYYWQIALASAISTLPVSSIQARENNQPMGESRVATQQAAQQLAQAGIFDSDNWSIKLSDNNYKWAIPPSANPAALDNPATPLAVKPEASKKSTSYFQPSSSYSTQPESDPPRYVKTLSKTGIEAFKDITWLDVGLDHRTRYEFRSNDIRRTNLTLDQPFLLRSRAYVGIRELLDPFRGAIEFQDSRRYNGKFPHDDRDFNEHELIQGYGELYFKHALGQDDRNQDRPIRFRIGRMAYEALDRRLIGRNEWRNTTNTFEGFRINLGREVNDWEVDLWAYQPVKRFLTTFDQRIENQWFYGVIGHWRKWSDIITLQPYYMGLIQDGSKMPGQVDREIHAPALRGYGKIGNTNLDYDFNLIYQFGRNGAERHEAHGYTLEAGYTFKHDWKPRISAFYGYASGDRHPNDNVNNRFERFFGFARPWSADDYIVFENIKAPKIKLEFQPAKDLRIDGGYGWFWLASSTDRFNNLLDGNNSAIRNPGFNRDPTGRSGDFIGHAFDIRARYKLTANIDATVGYSHFVSGNFTRNRQIAALGKSPGSSNFLYMEVVVSAF
ncbi:alginate export protein [Nitrosospira sp. Nsp5]|uniref:Alginate export n=1 Tax=Nitrosospira multiformis TaxID=1231 RepID=A0ABY0T9P8_9PROT|nr:MULTISPECIES: alginate export family protein [Nitrosospira]PTR08011.1 alginate export protein [Nitrosospira sp. Nsp5]SDQ46705.1 Alginate export [Nitrosospira multiformis]